MPSATRSRPESSSDQRPHADRYSSAISPGSAKPGMPLAINESAQNR